MLSQLQVPHCTHCTPHFLPQGELTLNRTGQEPFTVGVTAHALDQASQCSHRRLALLGAGSYTPRSYRPPDQPMPSQSVIAALIKHSTHQ